MSWWDIIKIRDFEGDFPGTTLEAISEELSTDNIKVIFDEMDSIFIGKVNHPAFPNTIIEWREDAIWDHSDSVSDKLVRINRFIRQANVFIKFIDGIIDAFKPTNMTTTPPLADYKGVIFIIKESNYDLELKLNIFMHPDTDIGYRINGENDGTWIKDKDNYIRKLNHLFLKIKRAFSDIKGEKDGVGPAAA